jgi:hypothetical protein
MSYGTRSAMTPSGPLLDEATRGDGAGLATRAHVGGIAFAPSTQGSTTAQMGGYVHKNAYR